MCLTGWSQTIYLFVTSLAAFLIICSFAVVILLEYLGKRSEKKIADAIDQATEFRSDFD